MNKTELIDRIAEKSQVSKAVVADLVGSFVETITETLEKGESVTIVGFGTFKVSHSNARTGRNPQTGETIKIAARKTPRFTAGKQLKEACNSKDKE